MNWLTDPALASPSLPACWLVETMARPSSRAARSLLRRQVARQVIAAQLGRASGLFHDSMGRPFIAGQDRVHISYATRAGAVVVALAQDPVGADLEEIESLEDLPWHVLHEQEQTMLRALSGPGRDVAFYRIWTAKEAVLKLLGTGLSTEPASLAIDLEQGMAHLADGSRISVRTRIMERGNRRLALAIALGSARSAVRENSAI